MIVKRIHGNIQHKIYIELLFFMIMLQLFSVDYLLSWGGIELKKKVASSQVVTLGRRICLPLGRDKTDRPRSSLPLPSPFWIFLRVDRVSGNLQTHVLVRIFSTGLYTSCYILLPTWHLRLEHMEDQYLLGEFKKCKEMKRWCLSTETSLVMTLYILFSKQQLKQKFTTNNTNWGLNARGRAEGDNKPTECMN